MPRPRRLTRDEILRQLKKFAREMGRPPSSHEQGFQNIVYSARREFGSWKHALKIAGLQTYSAWKKKRTLKGKIHALLKYNPMTMKELREKLNKSSDFSSRIGASIRQSKDIKFIGPRRKRVYFLEGQENLAKVRLSKISSKIHRFEEETYYHLRHPLTKAQLEHAFEQNLTKYDKTKLVKCTKEFLRARLIYKAKFVAGARGSKKFKSNELFGNLAYKTYYCRFDCPEEVAGLIIAHIPADKLTDSGFRRALTHHLKRIFPDDVFFMVQKAFWY